MNHNVSTPNNENGNYDTTLERQMAAYDMLPPKARKALQEAQFDWATEPLLKRWQRQRRGYKTDGHVSRQIKRMDANLAFGLRVLGKGPSASTTMRLMTDNVIKPGKLVSDLRARGEAERARMAAREAAR